ncbi:hypothetical protein Nepgr_032108 [Nepenthes gracilis]|uniref:Uncharacterized protein n=1 Tax=Nepenthes gracilis TaxID=150966 RepID=A0AAD3TIP2_NEPGR|nr:hypothetical protein Nepgr_032108 [Nepenthes gracilis]
MATAELAPTATAFQEKETPETVAIEQAEVETPAAKEDLKEATADAPAVKEPTELDAKEGGEVSAEVKAAELKVVEEKEEDSAVAVVAEEAVEEGLTAEEVDAPAAEGATDVEEEKPTEVSPEEVAPAATTFHETVAPEIEAPEQVEVETPAAKEGVKEATADTPAVEKSGELDAEEDVEVVADVAAESDVVWETEKDSAAAVVAGKTVEEASTVEEVDAPAAEGAADVEEKKPVEVPQEEVSSE